MASELYYYLRNDLENAVNVYSKLQDYHKIKKFAKFTDKFFYDVYSNRFVGDCGGKRYVCLGTAAQGPFHVIDTFNCKQHTVQERMQGIVSETKKYIRAYHDEESLANKDHYVCLYDTSVNSPNFFENLVFAPAVQLVPPFYDKDGYVPGMLDDAKVRNRVYMWMHRTMGQSIDSTWFVKNIEDVFKLTGLPKQNKEDYVIRAKNVSEILSMQDVRFIPPLERATYFTVRANMLKCIEVNACKKFADEYYKLGVDKYMQPLKNIKNFNVVEVMCNYYHERVHNAALKNDVFGLAEFSEEERKAIYQRVILANASLNEIKLPNGHKKRPNQQELEDVFSSIVSKKCMPQYAQSGVLQRNY